MKRCPTSSHALKPRRASGCETVESVCREETLSRNRPITQEKRVRPAGAASCMPSLTAMAGTWRSIASTTTKRRRWPRLVAIALAGDEGGFKVRHVRCPCFREDRHLLEIVDLQRAVGQFRTVPGQI